MSSPVAPPYLLESFQVLVRKRSFKSVNLPRRGDRNENSEKTRNSTREEKPAQREGERQKERGKECASFRDL